MNIFERNQKGETALSIAQEKKIEKAIKLLEQVSQYKGDETSKKTEELLNELLMEEQKKEKKKEKNKDKNKRKKIR